MYDELVKRLRNCTAEQNGEKTLLCQAADAIEDLNEQLENETEYATALNSYVPQWIPVAERLPKENEDVLVYLWDRKVPYLAWVDTEGRWETNDFYIDIEDKPKEWMPLPKPYEPA